MHTACTCAAKPPVAFFPCPSINFFFEKLVLHRSAAPRIPGKFNRLIFLNGKAYFYDRPLRNFTHTALTPPVISLSWERAKLLLTAEGSSNIFE